VTTYGFVASDMAGGGYLRSIWPARALTADGHDIRWVSTSYPHPGSVDVLVVHRPLGVDAMDRLQQQRAKDTIVVVDEDDDLTAVPDDFPLRDRLWDWAEALERHDTYVAAADGLVCSSDELATRYTAKRAWVCKNRLPSDIGNTRWYGAEDDNVRVGWTGITATHSQNLKWLASVADQAFAGAIFTTVGDGNTARLLNLERTPVELHAFQRDLHAYYKLMSQADIGIVPLVPDQFNRSKSWLKALEYMTLGKPVVATRLPEQQQLIKHGKTGFLATNPKSFAGYVQRLINDPDLRIQMGKAAHERARSFGLERNLGAWKRVLADTAAMRTVLA
jgi:glycosyltransferase involved in cell wall biosynthesis